MLLRFPTSRQLEGRTQSAPPIIEGIYRLQTATAAAILWNVEQATS